VVIAQVTEDLSESFEVLDGDWVVGPLGVLGQTAANVLTTGEPQPGSARVQSSDDRFRKVADEYIRHRAHLLTISHDIINLTTDARVRRWPSSSAPRSTVGLAGDLGGEVSTGFSTSPALVGPVENR
jgi:hypothetical protein